MRNNIFTKYKSKPISWWLQTPLYAARIVSAKVKRSPRENAKSANNEDRIIYALLNLESGYCVEVGALDGINGSNSLYFEKRNWKCLLVEADPTMAAICARNRPKSVTFSAAAVAPEMAGRVQFQVIEHNRAMSSLSFDAVSANHFEAHGVEFKPTTVEIEGKTLDSMLNEARFPRVDFVTIDVEGHEADVLRGFDLRRWNPHLIMLERIQKEVDPKVASIMAEYGYQRILSVPLGATEDCNDFWFKKEST